MKNEKTKTMQEIEEEKAKMAQRIMAIQAEVQEQGAKRLSRALILNAVSRFMADPARNMTTNDVLSTAQKWAQWVEGE